MGQKIRKPPVEPGQQNLGPPNKILKVKGIKGWKEKKLKLEYAHNKQSSL